MDIEGRCRLLIVLIFVIIYHTTLCEDISQDYLTDVKIHCNNTAATISDHSETQTSLEKHLYGTVVVNQLWLLPKGGIVQSSNTSDNKARRIFASFHNEVSVLQIKRIDDEDFGIYWCVQVWNDTTVRAIRHTLNLDGPPLDAFYEQQRHNAIVGAISGGTVLGVFIFAYIVWYFRCSEKVMRKKRLTEDLAKGVNRYSTQIYDNVGMDMYVKKSDR